MSAHSEKFSANLDEYLIKGICGHFGVLPSEIGYADGGSLGGTGQQVGEAQSGEVIGVEPLMLWFADQISDISYKFLGMPRELVFQFNGGRETDSEQMANRRKAEIDSAQRSINEARAELSLPLIDSPAADSPMIVTARGLFMFTEEGIMPVEQPAPSPATPSPLQDTKPAEQPESVSPVEQDSEVKAFLRWAKKGDVSREFDFIKTDRLHADTLNAARHDYDLAKTLSEGILGKAEAAGMRPSRG
jgi:hypothetical protein